MNQLNKTIITEALLEKGKSSKGGWNKHQFKCLGIEWPPKTGWKDRIIGKEITIEKANEFIRKKGK